MNRNIGPITKIVVATTLTCGALGASAGGAVDHLAGEGIHQLEREYDQDGNWVGTYTLNDARQDLLEANAELEDTRVDVEATIGSFLDETCRNGIRPYRLGGEFADVPEEGVISDLILEPALPCQGWRRQLRAIVRVVRSQDKRVEEELRSVTQASEHLEEFKGYRVDDEDFNGALYVGLVSSAAGLASALATAPSRIRRRKNKTQEPDQDQGS